MLPRPAYLMCAAPSNSSPSSAAVTPPRTSRSLSCLTSRPKTELDIEARGPTVLWGLDAAEGGCRWVMALRSGLVEQPGKQRQSRGDQ